MRPHVVVIGGGFAGGAAASALAEAGVSVTLLEKRPILGGRASSLRDGVTKEDVDNGQHLFMGCYRDTRTFLRRLKVEDRLRFESRFEVPFLLTSGRAVLGAGVSGVMGFRALRWRDKLSLLRGLARIRLSRKPLPADLTVAGWLDRLRQTPGARRAFWTPLCLATLNARPEAACAAALAVVLKQGLFGSAKDRALGYATVSLGKLWPVELPGFLKARGGVVSTEQIVRGLEVEDGRVTHVHLMGSEGGAADAIICALPLAEFLEVCPDVLYPRYEALSRAEHGAIASVNLWFDRPVLADRFAGLLDGEVQWVFNRTALWEGRGTSDGYVSLVVSDARAWTGLSSEEIVARALSDLRKVLPGVPAPRHASVVWERRATPVPTPAFWAARPPVETPLKNLFLAGDWIDSGLPPTIEAACRSGHRAAAAARAYVESLAAKDTAPC